MSLLNFAVQEDVGLLCVDTTTRSDDGSYSERSKMLHLGHINGVVACRGDIKFLAVLFTGLGFDPPTDFDALLETWPQRLATATEPYLQYVKQPAPGADPVPCFVALLGWSHSHGRPVCHTAVRGSAAEPFKVKAACCSVGPIPDCPVPNLTAMQLPDAVRAMDALVREQVSKVRRDLPGAPIGGRLLLAEVTREGTSIRELATLG